MPRTLAQNAQYIAETIKPAIKSAIEAQGVTVPSTDSFLDYADRIGEIEGGGSGYQLKDLPTGSISTVNDAAELPLNALKVSVEAQQDLHGYDYPWVGGAGKNKLPLTIVSGTTKNGVTLTVNDDGTVTIKGQATAQTIFNVGGFTVQDAMSVKYSGASGGSSTTYSISIAVNNQYVYTQIYNGESSAVSLNANDAVLGIIIIRNGYVCPADGIKFSPMIRLASETDSTFAPYSNICPIHGWDSGEISVTGVNQWDEEWEVGTYNNTTGEKEANELIIRAKNYIKINPNTKYTTVAGFMELFFYDKNYTYLGNITNGGYQADIQPHEITSLTNAYYMTFRLATQYGTTYNNDISINYPSSDTSYHAYNGTTTSQQFPQTIYGAEWDVVGGELKQTDGYIASYNGETLPSTWISDRDVYASGTTPTIGAEVVYKLATPTTIALSPLSIRMNEGTNNLYADCGEVLEGEYFVDEGAIDVRKVDYQIGSSGSIKTTDGRVLSGFASMNGYHSRPLDASGNWLDVDWSKDFEIGVAFKFTALPNYQGITGDGNANSYRKAPRIYYDNSEGKLALCVSSDGSTLAIDTFLNHTFVVDKWYFIKAKFVLSTMTFSADITEDFSTFTSLYNGVMASAPYHDAASLCFGGDAQQSNMASNTFLIDTFNTYIKGDGVSWGAFTGAFPS